VRSTSDMGERLSGHVHSTVSTIGKSSRSDDLKSQVIDTIGCIAICSNTQVIHTIRQEIESSMQASMEQYPVLYCEDDSA